jgi:hypothetical protein
MGKPLMLQAADAERIETLKKRLGARTKMVPAWGSSPRFSAYEHLPASPAAGAPFGQ